jgi:dipeptidase E
VQLLLTSAGISNASIHTALVDMLGKPVEECAALCIPTALYGHPQVGPGSSAWEFVSGQGDLQMSQLGWKSVGLLELTALPSIDPERWVPLVRAADVLLVAGDDDTAIRVLDGVVDVISEGHWRRFDAPPPTADSEARIESSGS